MRSSLAGVQIAVGVVGVLTALDVGKSGRLFLRLSRSVSAWPMVVVRSMICDCTRLTSA
jgi:hypothetical protein